MKKYLLLWPLFGVIAQLHAQDCNISDTSRFYDPPKVYYDDTLKPTVTINEIMKHVELKGESKMMYPRCIVLDTYFRRHWLITKSNECYQKIVVPDFRSPYTRYYWDDKLKCIWGIISITAK